MGQASLNGVTPSQKMKPIVVIEYTRTFTQGLPHKLKLFTSSKTTYTLQAIRATRRHLPSVRPAKARAAHSPTGQHSARLKAGRYPLPT